MTYRRLWLMVLAGLVASGVGVAPRHAGAAFSTITWQVDENILEPRLAPPGGYASVTMFLQVFADPHSLFSEGGHRLPDGASPAPVAAVRRVLPG
jgi:hypothetical protein